MASFRAIVLILCATLSVGTAFAGPPKGAQQRATKHERRGKAAYAAGDYEACIREFQKAHIEVPSERYVYNIAKCSERAEDYAQAIEYYWRYLEMVPEAEDRAEVEIFLRVLHEKQRELRGSALVTITSRPTARVSIVREAGVEALIGVTPLIFEFPIGTHTLRFEAEQHEPAVLDLEVSPGGDPVMVVLEPLPRGLLHVNLDVTQAQVLIDGVSHAPGDSPFALAPGEHEVVVIAPGREPVRRQVTVAAGAVESVWIGVAVPDAGVTSQAEEPDTAADLALWGYVTGGVGLAILGTAAGLGVVANKRARSANELTAADHTRGDHQALVQSSETMATIANVGFGVGSALVAAGIGLIIAELVTEPAAPTESRRLSPALRGGDALGAIRF